MFFWILVLEKPCEDIFFFFRKVKIKKKNKITRL